MPAKGNEFSSRPSPRSSSAIPPCASSSSAKGSCSRARGAGAALGLGDRLVFSGFQRDVARALSALDLVVFPSLWEGTPLTVFEALAMGKPIVATDADGLMDVLTDGQDALVVPKRDSARWPTRCARSSSSPSGPRRWGAAPAPPARTTTSAFVHKMERLYDCCTRPRAPPDGPAC
jgi:hypothetical protein